MKINFVSKFELFLKKMSKVVGNGAPVAVSIDWDRFMREGFLMGGSGGMF